LCRYFTYKPASVFQAFRDILEEDQKEDEEEYVLEE
jgi:ATP synthase protein I